MVCEIKKIDSNITSLNIAEEECIGQLPGVDGADAVWYEQEPNGYSDFGGQITNVARNPIKKDRQRQKGNVTDITVSGGYSSDFTQNNMVRNLQGFFFADAREKPDTAPINGTGIAFTAVDANSYNAASGLNIFKVNHLCMASGFSTTANRGLFRVTAIGDAAVAATNITAQTGVTFTATTTGTGPNGVTSMRMIDPGVGNGVADGSAITVTTEAITVNIRKVADTIRTRTEVAALFSSASTPLAGIIIAAVTASGGTAAVAGAASFFTGGLAAIATGTLVTDKVLTVEASPPAASRVIAVGFQFPASDATLSIVGSVLRLNSASVDLTTLGLNVGEWIFIGGDATANIFTTVLTGYARIKTIAVGYVELDDTTFNAAADAGTSKLVRIFFSTVIRNEQTPSLIKTRSYSIERQLGEDSAGVQAEYLEGSVANEFTLNIPQANKLAVDLKFVPIDTSFRDGATGIKAGTRIAALGESAFNSSSDLYRLKINILDAADSNPTGLFAYATTASLMIKNGVAPVKVLGHLGAVDTSSGDFMASGSVTALFSTLEAVQAIKDNADVAINGIFAHSNAGFVFDIPLVALGGGKINVVKDKPIDIPITAEGAENAAGYTMLVNFFTYLPTVAMP